MVRLWSNRHFRALLWAVLGAIRAAKFQSVTTKMGAVTAEAAGSSPVVPGILSPIDTRSVEKYVQRRKKYCPTKLPF